MYVDNKVRRRLLFVR